MTDNATALVHKPQVNVSLSTPGRMWLICVCAALAVIQSSLSDSGASLIVAACAVCAAVLAELLITYKAHGFSKIKDGSAAASALVLSLLLPNQIHPAYAVLGAIFAMVVVKHSFGGLGSNWLNPGLGGFLFIRLSWPGIYDSALADSPLRVIGESLHNGSDALEAPMKLISIHTEVTPLANTVGSFLNNTVFSLTGSELPAGYIDLLISRAPGIIADRGLLALLAGTIIITAFRITRSWIPLAYAAFFSLLVFVFGDLPFEGMFFKGDVLFALFSGGTVAAVFMLVPDPATGAKSQIGILAAALCAAFLTWLFRYYYFEVYGAFFAVALVNSFTPLLRLIEGRFFYSRKLKHREARHE
jgi:electron transport complex protein RnfD